MDVNVVDVLKEIVDIKQLTGAVLIPGIVWSAGIIKEHIGRFLEKREMTRALAVYNIVQQAVGTVWDEIVKPVKDAAPGEKLSTEVRTLAMNTALQKVQEIAAKKGQEKWIPPIPELALKVEQVIKDRKNGVFSPILPVK